MIMHRSEDEAPIVGLLDLTADLTAERQNPLKTRLYDIEQTKQAEPITFIYY